MKTTNLTLSDYPLRVKNRDFVAGIRKPGPYSADVCITYTDPERPMVFAHSTFNTLKVYSHTIDSEWDKFEALANAYRLLAFHYWIPLSELLFSGSLIPSIESGIPRCPSEDNNVHLTHYQSDYATAHNMSIYGRFPVDPTHPYTWTAKFDESLTPYGKYMKFYQPARGNARKNFNKGVSFGTLENPVLLDEIDNSYGPFFLESIPESRKDVFGDYLAGIPSRLLSS